MIRSNAKYLTHDAIVARFDPYMYAFDGSYQHVTQVRLAFQCFIWHHLISLTHYIC